MICFRGVSLFRSDGLMCAARLLRLELIRLDTGGPVIGLLPLCRYEQGSVALQPGDVLLTFTDGISEAMNVKDEEFGEERLVAAVKPALTLAPRALITHIMSAAKPQPKAALCSRASIFW